MPRYVRQDTPHRRESTHQWPPFGGGSPRSAVLVAPAALPLPDRLPGVEVLISMLLLGVICTGMTLVLFYRLIAHSGPGRATLAFYLSPTFAVVFGAALLRERITVATGLGLGAVIAGCALAAYRPEPSPG